MRIAIAQIDSTVGDFSGNAEKILAYARRARKEYGAELALFPELALTGYPPLDLLRRDAFVEANLRALNRLVEELPSGIAVGVGYAGRKSRSKALVNAYGVILDHRLVFSQAKIELADGEVFDETRCFESGRTGAVFSFKSERIGFAVSDDAWAASPVENLFRQGITMLCVPSASPYRAGASARRLERGQSIAQSGQVPLVYINAAGANDSVIFDGSSFITAPADGGPDVLKTAKSFEEDLVFWDSGSVLEANAARDENAGGGGLDAGFTAGELDALEKAIVTGIRCYAKKAGFSRAHAGLSGGIDSALVVYLAAEALGRENVVCLGMPSRFSSEGSLDDSALLAENLGLRFEILPIENIYAASLDTLAAVFEGRPFDIAEENLQARIRGALLMAYSNKFGSMLLTTGNKSELAMGYCTLYGDMNGALGPIGDLFKTEVFALCRRINARSLAEKGKAVIPEAIITKPPSAELRPDQRDEDSLPPYEELDAILRLYLLEDKTKEEITSLGLKAETVERVIRSFIRAEFKRGQAAQVLKLSERTFGMGRRLPVNRRIYEF